LFTLRLAQDAEILGRVQNTFEFQPGILVPACTLVPGLRLLVCVQEGRMDLAANRKGADHDEACWLHQSDGGRIMSRFEKPGQQGIW
jgi:hypothetical protein